MTLIEDYCLRYNDKKLHPTRWIAIKILQEHPELVDANCDRNKNIERIRSRVRYVRLEHGRVREKQRAEKQIYAPRTDERPWVFLVDIETAPVEGFFWGLRKQFIGIEQIKNDSFIISWAGKWLFDSEIKSDILTSEEILIKDDKRILQSLWYAMNQADVIIGQNGDKFDIPKINWRFLMHKMSPPMPYQTIDTLKVLHRIFGATSNKLDFVNRQLGLTPKIYTGGFELWRDCLNGYQEALDIMEEYNKNDVQALEELYVLLRPWIKSHPNIGLYKEGDGEYCPNCGSSNLDWRDNRFYYTPLGKYSAFRCADCQCIGRSRVSALSGDERKRLLSSIAR